MCLLAALVCAYIGSIEPHLIHDTNISLILSLSLVLRMCD